MSTTVTRPTKTLLLDVVSFISRFGLAAVWMWGGATKLNNHMEMTQTIMAYEIFTMEWSSFLARLIGPLEIAGGLLLLLGIFMRTASKVSIGVLVLFIIGISQAWARGLVIDCGCFGVETTVTDPVPGYISTIVRDVILIGLSAWNIWRPYKKFALYTP